MLVKNGFEKARIGNLTFSFEKKIGRNLFIKFIAFIGPFPHGFKDFTGILPQNIHSPMP